MNRPGIVIVSLAQALCILFAASAGWAQHPWPSFQHDPQHTGQGAAPGPRDATVRCEFVASESLFASTDVGATWTIADQGLTGLVVRSLAVAPSMVTSGVSIRLTRFGCLPGTTFFGSRSS